MKPPPPAWLGFVIAMLAVAMALLPMPWTLAPMLALLAIIQWLWRAVIRTNAEMKRTMDTIRRRYPPS